MCKEDGKPHIIEYYEMTDDMLNKRLPDGSLAYGFGAILNYLFPIQKLKETLDKSMPLHIVKKKVPYVDESGNPVTPEYMGGVEAAGTDAAGKDACISYDR